MQHLLVKNQASWHLNVIICSELTPFDESCLSCADEALRKNHSDGFIFLKNTVPHKKYHVRRSSHTNGVF